MDNIVCWNKVKNIKNVAYGLVFTRMYRDEKRGSVSPIWEQFGQHLRKNLEITLGNKKNKKRRKFSFRNLVSLKKVWPCDTNRGIENENAPKCFVSEHGLILKSIVY